MKYTKRPQNIRNGRKIDQLAKNMQTSSIARPSKIYPNWDFLVRKYAIWQTPTEAREGVWVGSFFLNDHFSNFLLVQLIFSASLLGDGILLFRESATSPEKNGALVLFLFKHLFFSSKHNGNAFKVMTISVQCINS
jgi:hypothetical protein